MSIGIAVAALLLGLSIVPLILGGVVSFSYGTTTLGPALVLLLGFTIQGGAEEVVYRGFLLQAARKRLPLFAAIPVQTVAFSIPHILNPSMTPIGMANVVLAGLFFGYLTVWTGSLWAPIICHALWNWAQAALLGYNVSGVPVRGISLFNPSNSEGSSSILTGGENGVEGMLTAVLALALVTALLTFTLRRRRGADSH